MAIMGKRGEEYRICAYRTTGLYGFDLMAQCVMREFTLDPRAIVIGTTTHGMGITSRGWTN